MVAVGPWDHRLPDRRAARLPGARPGRRGPADDRWSRAHARIPRTRRRCPGRATRGADPVIVDKVIEGMAPSCETLAVPLPPPALLRRRWWLLFVVFVGCARQRRCRYFPIGRCAPGCEQHQVGKRRLDRDEPRGGDRGIEAGADKRMHLPAQPGLAVGGGEEREQSRVSGPASSRQQLSAYLTKILNVANTACQMPGGQQDTTSHTPSGRRHRRPNTRSTELHPSGQCPPERDGEAHGVFEVAPRTPITARE
jgi:hypothetical protein